MAIFLQNRADIRLSLSASLFGYQLAKKYPFIEPGHAIPVEQEILDKVFAANKTWALWKEKDIVRIVSEYKTETNLVDTLTIEPPEDLNPEQDGGELETTQGTEKASKPRGGRKS